MKEKRHNKRHWAILCPLILLLFASPPLMSDEPTGIEGIKYGYGTDDPEPVTLDFETTLGVAITRSFELKAIHAKKEIFNLNIGEKFRDFFPSLTVSYMKNEQSSVHDTDSRLHQLTLESNILVYDGGKRSLAYDIAKLESILARNDYRIALNKLILQVQEAYLQALTSRGAIGIHQKTLERGKMQLDFIRKERDLGEATELSVMEIESKVKEIELNLEKARDEYMTAINQLKLIMKIDWRVPIELAGDIENDYHLFPLAEKNEPVDPNEFVAVALKNRKEIESVDVEYNIATRNYQIDKLYFFPKFYLGAKYTLSDNDPYGKNAFPTEHGWGLSLKITTALWGNSMQGGASYDKSENGNTKALTESGSLGVLDSMSYKKKIVESRITLFSSKEKKYSIRQQVSLEVLSAVTTLQNTWKMIDIAKKRLDLYDSFLVIERLKADMGESIRYELIKKEIERGQAAIDYLNTKARYIVTGSYLEIAMGINIGELKLSQMQSSQMQSSKMQTDKTKNPTKQSNDVLEK